MVLKWKRAANMPMGARQVGTLIGCRQNLLDVQILNRLVKSVPKMPSDLAADTMSVAPISALARATALGLDATDAICGTDNPTPVKPVTALYLLRSARAVGELAGGALAYPGTGAGR